MIGFYVNVSLMLPSIHEMYTYHLYNPTNRTITQSVVIPITFDTQYMVHYYYDIHSYCSNEIYHQSAKVDNYDLSHSTNRNRGYGSIFHVLDSSLKVNDKEVEYAECDIGQPAPDLELPEDWYIYGYSTSVDFKPKSITILEFNLNRSIEYQYTSIFTYFYSARTGGLWNGTIGYGYFHLECPRDYKWIWFNVPNAEIGPSGREVTSIVWDTEGSDYMVTIPEGFTLENDNYKHYYYPTLPPIKPINEVTSPDTDNSEVTPIFSGTAEGIEEPHNFVLHNPWGILLLAFIMCVAQRYVFEHEVH